MVKKEFHIHFGVSKCEECFLALKEVPRSKCRLYDKTIHFTDNKPPFCRVKTIIVEVEEAEET